MSVPAVSVIVPVYNAEKYLYCCIDGVLSQTFWDWELILVDDGSKDNSGAICDEYTAKDERIRVFHKENTGVSDTRNQGLDVARGKYVFFLDADDFWLRDDVLEVFVERAEKYNLDIIRGEYAAMHEDGTFAWSREISGKRREYAEKLLSNVEFLEHGIHGENFLPLSMFKRSCIASLRLEKGRLFLEDMLFYSTLLLQDLRCMYLPDMRFYGYRKNDGSASNQVSVKKLSDSFSMCYRFHDLAQQATIPSLKEKYVYNSIMMYYWTLDTLAQKDYYSKRMELIKELRLENLLRDVRRWKKGYSKFIYSPIFYLSPSYGVNLFYIRWLMQTTRHSVKMFFCKKRDL